MTRLGTTFLAGTLIFSFACSEKKQGAGTAKIEKKGSAAPAKKEAPAKKAAKGGYVSQDAVADAGKIMGAVTYAGDKKDEKAAIKKDQCPDAPEANNGAILVKETKVKNALVYIKEIKTGKKYEPSDVTVDNLNCLFAPRVSIGYLGAQIVAKNSDPVLHNTHAYLKEGNKNLFNIALPNKDQQVKKKLKKPGFVDIKCDAHEWMQSWMYVATHPYVTLTGEDGSFALDQVPAGDYQVVVWHEALAPDGKEMAAKVTAGGDLKLDTTL